MPSFAARGQRNGKVQLDAVHIETNQISAPMNGRVGFLGAMIGRVSTRVINGFLSDERGEPKFPPTILQAVFLMGVMDIISDNYPYSSD